MSKSIRSHAKISALALAFCGASLALATPASKSIKRSVCIANGGEVNMIENDEFQCASNNKNDNGKLTQGPVTTFEYGGDAAKSSYESLKGVADKGFDEGNVNGTRRTYRNISCEFSKSAERPNGDYYCTVTLK